MIAIVLSNVRERAALGPLCESRGWPCSECDSLHGLKKLLREIQPRAVLTRSKLVDGYSDDVLSTLRAAGLLPATKVIVLIGPGASSAQEARQIALGADCVMRDPVRIDVLMEYLAKYRNRPLPTAPRARGTTTTLLSFASAAVDTVARQVKHAGKFAHLTPREVRLVELLLDSPGQLVTYSALYNEILGRRFRGDTGNMRVLLGKLDASFRSVGIALRHFVEVIPKSGYRYIPGRHGFVSPITEK